MNGVITDGHSLIALAVALVGGVVVWLIANRRKDRAERGEYPSSAGSMIV